jgi:hypothetical protein
MYDCSLMSVLRDVDLLHLGTLSLWPCSDPPNFLSSPYHLRSLPLPACFYSFLSPCSTHTDPLHQIQHTQLWCLQTLTFLSFLPSPSYHSFLQVQNHWFSTILPTTNLTPPWTPLHSPHPTPPLPALLWIWHSNGLHPTPPPPGFRQEGDSICWIYCISLFIIERIKRELGKMWKGVGVVRHMKVKRSTFNRATRTS